MPLHLINGYAGEANIANMINLLYQMINLFHLALTALDVEWYGEWVPSEACRDAVGLPGGCWEADLSGQGVEALTGLRLEGKRQIRARYPNADPELDRVIDGEYIVHDGQMGWIGEDTEWIESGAHGMNGVAGPWPPAKPATTHIIEDVDWPSVDWPMHITTNGTVDPSDWTGEGGWGQFCAPLSTSRKLRFD